MNKTLYGLMVGFLLWMPCARSTAQSIKPGAARRGVDSAAVAAQFVANARPLLDSLTALHFARLKISFLQGQVKERESQRDDLAGQLSECHQNTGQQIGHQVDDKQQIGQLTQQKNSGQLKTWLLGAALALSIYLHVVR
ncbi:hypothetical protein [Spirosoma oryzicola]|uniref:hypothetical protein n=1 Tax=Spirosoma oryzicola TaxID=2898794 RepID=UPI001E4239B0|nr:hypothetical protein [Spirosoma oryzicola]UHG90097.1 hypothetical protein LQ777_17815 [Spirosoma oryzicola]